jgi:hypothetical protein
VFVVLWGTLRFEDLHLQFDEGQKDRAPFCAPISITIHSKRAQSGRESCMSCTNSNKLNTCGNLLLKWPICVAQVQHENSH